MEALFSGKSALILDKKLEDLQSLRSILGSLGFGEVLAASSVNMALSMLRELPVDFCFLCYDLGRDEKNGLQLMLELQAEGLRRYGSCYVLVIEPEKSDLLLGSPENAPDLYISKPYDRIRVGQQLEKSMRRKKNLGAVEELLDKGEWEPALDECERLEELYPGMRVYLQRLRGAVLLRHNEPQMAYETFGLLMHGREQPWIRIGLAIAAARSGWFNQSAEQLDKVIGDQQICIEAFVWRARLHRLRGALGEAQNLLRQAVVLQPTVALLQGDLGDIAAMNNDARLAVDAFRAAIRYSRYSAFQHPDYYFGLVRMLLDQMLAKGGANPDAEEEAIRMLEQAQRDFLDMPVINFRCRLLSSEVYRRVGDKQSGELAARDAVGLFQELSLDERLMWLDQLIEGGEGTSVAEEVVGLRQELTKQMAGLKWGRANLKGMTQFRHGDLDPALDSFIDAYEQQQGNAGIGLNLVQTALEIVRRSSMPMQERDLLALCDETLYALHYAALTPKQKQRYRGLGERLSEVVGRLNRGAA